MQEIDAFIFEARRQVHEMPLERIYEIAIETVANTLRAEAIEKELIENLEPKAKDKPCSKPCESFTLYVGE